MDPRFPEKTLLRLKELIKQFERIRADIENTELSSTLAGLEREGVLVVQEITLVSPRLHDYLMQISRNQRMAIVRGLVKKPVEKSEPESGMMDEATADKILDAIEKVAPAPKKSTRKKKTAKKAEK